MPQDARLDRRIAAAIQVITNIVQPRDEHSAQQCRNRAEIAIRTIAGWDGWPLTPGAERKGYVEAVADGWPFIMAGRSGAQRRSYLDAAAKIREALAMIHPIFLLDRSQEANAVEQFAEDLEKAAREILDRRGGGSDQALIEKQRKLKTAEYARSLLTMFGPNPPRRNTQQHLAEVLFKAATGRSSDLRRAVDAMRRQA